MVRIEVVVHGGPWSESAGHRTEESGHGRVQVEVEVDQPGANEALTRLATGAATAMAEKIAHALDS